MISLLPSSLCHRKYRYCKRYVTKCRWMLGKNIGAKAFPSSLSRAPECFLRASCTSSRASATRFTCITWELFTLRKLESPLELFLSAGLVVLSPLGQCPLWSTWNSGLKQNFNCMLTSSVSTAGWCLCCWSSRRSRASWPSSRTQTRWVVGCTWWIGLWIEDYFHLYSCIYCICILIFCGEDSRYAYCIKSKPFVVFSILK